LILGAVGKRADVRDVLIYRHAGASPARGFGRDVKVKDFRLAR
jgi:hypothetical protein